MDRKEIAKTILEAKGKCVEVHICSVCINLWNIYTSTRIIANGHVVVNLWNIKNVGFKSRQSSFIKNYIYFKPQQTSVHVCTD